MKSLCPFSRGKTSLFGASPELQSLRQSGHPKALRRCHLRRGAGRGRRRSRGRRGLEPGEPTKDGGENHGKQTKEV